MQNASITFVLAGPDPLIFGLWRNLDFNGHKGTDAADGTADTDLATVGQMDTAIEEAQFGGPEALAEAEAAAAAAAASAASINLPSPLVARNRLVVKADITG